MNDLDYPPVVLGRLDDESGWRRLNPRSAGVLDWMLTAFVVILGIVPVLLTWGVCWAVRRFSR